MYQQLTINTKVISWNLLVGRNRWTYKRIKDEWHQLAWVAIKQARLEPFKASQYPLTVTFKVSWKAKRHHDVDSLFLKPLTDSLVENGIIPDDCTDYVNEVRIVHVTDREDRLIVVLEGRD